MKRTFKNEKGDKFTFEGVSKKDIKICLDTIPRKWTEVRRFDILAFKDEIIIISIILIIGVLIFKVL